MAKKKTKSTSSKMSVDVPITSVDIDPHILEKLMRRDAEFKNAVLTEKVAELVWQQTLVNRRAESKSLKEVSASANKEFDNVVKEIEKKYLISLKEFAYDETLGKLTRVE